MGGAVTIRALVGPKDRKAFVLFPRRLYANDPDYVAPLVAEELKKIDPEKSPFFHHSAMQLFFAERAGAVVGRIAAVHNRRHNEFHQDAVGFFGFFECENRLETAHALLDAAAAWLRERGLARMRGPANPTMNDECGLLVDGFDSPPVLQMTYNPPYYERLLTTWGLAKAMDLWAYEVAAGEPPEGLKKAAEQVLAQPGVVVRPMDKGRWDDEVDNLKLIYNMAWEKNWGFVPMTDSEIASLARDFKFIVDPSLVLFAEVDGKLAGMAATLPDYNQVLKRFGGKLGPWELLRLPIYARKIDMARVYILGVLKEHRALGLGAPLYLKTWEAAVRRGIKRAEMSWILENNEPMNRAIRMLGGRVYKTYRMYERGI